MTFGYHPVGAPHAYTNRRCANPARMQHKPALVYRIVVMTTKGLMDCGKAGDFRLVLGMLTH